LSDYSSKSNHFLDQRSGQVPTLSPIAAQEVSEWRRNGIADEVRRGLFRDGSFTGGISDGEAANVQVAVRRKYGQVLTGGEAALNGGIGPNASYRGGFGDSVKQVPQVYSPLWLNSNLNLPRDRVTINAWCRSFYALNPFVHNAINLHSTYPISKLNIKCHNQEIQEFFDEMIENLDLLNICTQIAQEYWLLGEAFVYAELDNSRGVWSRLLIENPDYMIVKRTVVANEPIIMMRPDENLKRIINSNRPADLEQKKQLNQYIIDAVRRGENIVLDNLNVHHLARKISPYEIRGTGLPVCIFRALMIFDQMREAKYVQSVNMINPLTIIKIGSADYKPDALAIEAWRNAFECYDEETEVLTADGFKSWQEVIEYQEVMDGTYAQPRCYAQPKNGIKIACFNPKTEELEYHQPSAASVYNYEGEMYHFHNEKIDIKVTPNHDMWVSQSVRQKARAGWQDWSKVRASDLAGNKDPCFRIKARTEENEHWNVITLTGQDTSVEQYNGKVWCFTVPTGLFITRRNGKITIQGNSVQYDNDAKIFTHDGVTVERVGWNQGIYDTSSDITQLMKEIFIGLQVPQVLMDGSDITYANGGVALDVLRQRYMQFRSLLSNWLRNKIFAPISKIQGFYEYKNKKKRLIVPEIDWNHMSLFDTNDYIQNLLTMTSGKGPEKRASLHSLYRAMGLEWDDEVRKKRKEAIQDAIDAQEQLSLSKMPLPALRSLGDDDEIPEPDTLEATEQPVPGEMAGGGAGPDMGAPPPPMGGLPGLAPPPTPTPPAPGGPPGPGAAPPPGGAPPVPPAPAT
jgi:hypothetical protein